MARRAPIAITVPAAAVIALATASPTDADVGIRDLRPRAARVGDLVRVTAGGYLGPKPWPSMPVALVPLRKAPRPRPCMNGRAICRPTLRYSALAQPPFALLGSVRRWRRDPVAKEHGTGSLVFRVPRVGSGRYVVGLFCAECVAGPRGSLIIAYDLVLRLRPR